MPDYPAGRPEAGDFRASVTVLYPGMMQPMWPNEVKAAIEQGLTSWETIEKHCFRVLRNKFDLGLFEDPYSNLDDVLEMVADMLFGAKEPTGKLVFEMPWTTEDAELDWGELQLDTGVDTATRLYMAATVRNNPTAQLPNNLGDVMYTTEFGMNYTDKADIVCDTLVVPQTVVSWEEETSSGMQTQRAARDILYAGQPFSIYFIAQNNGTGDGTVNAVVTDNGEPVAEKLVSLTAGQFRVIAIELTLEAGTHEIEVLGMTKTLEVK